jgi:uncharacterized membrane protein
MKVNTFGIKVWRGLSVALVLGGTAFGYSLLPEDVAVHFNGAGQPDAFMSKAQIFYLFMGLILVNNVLVMALAKRLLLLPSHLLPIPNQAAWSRQRDELNEHLRNWFYCIVAGINTILAVTMMALSTVNSNQSTYNLFDFKWLSYSVVILLLIIVAALPVRLLKKPKPQDA